jgi:hypothetical protein
VCSFSSYLLRNRLWYIVAVLLHARRETASIKSQTAVFSIKKLKQVLLRLLLPLQASIVDASTAAFGTLFQSRIVDGKNDCWTSAGGTRKRNLEPVVMSSGG